jgi:hypothetical protein
MAVTGDTLLVRARRTRGTERFEIWGLNTTTGEILWQKDLQGASPIDPPNEMAGLIDNTDYGWTWRMTTAGMQILTFKGEPNQLVIETLSLADGSMTSGYILPLKEIFGDFYSVPTVIGWQGDVIYLNTDTILYGIDTITGKKLFAH